MENLWEIHVNPDKAAADSIRQRIRENGGFCPCSLLKNPDTKCVCQDFLKQDGGWCHCGLYFKVRKEQP